MTLIQCGQAKSGTCALKSFPVRNRDDEMTRHRGAVHPLLDGKCFRRMAAYYGSKGRWGSNYIADEILLWADNVGRRGVDLVREGNGPGNLLSGERQRVRILNSFV